MEHEWTVGPIPFKDGLGREVVLRQASLTLIVVVWYASQCQQARARMHGSWVWLVKHDWTVGPIPFKDGLGREVVLRQASQPASYYWLTLQVMPIASQLRARATPADDGGMHRDAGLDMKAQPDAVFSTDANKGRS